MHRMAVVRTTPDLQQLRPFRGRGRAATSTPNMRERN